jgi:hypothetical protein
VAQRIKIGRTVNSSNTASAELRLRFVAPEHTTVALKASFRYSREDAYAVWIAFHVGLDDPIEWTFARDLLSTGIQGQRAGLGDVTVWPSAGTEDGRPGSVLNIELVSPFGRAHFEAPAGEISDFLRRTYQIVPAGQESEYINVEAELNNLLRQAAQAASFESDDDAKPGA